MNEMSKAIERRKKLPVFADRYFVGKGLDIGCGNDIMHTEAFPLVERISGYDKCFGNRDAMYLPEIGDNAFDFVVSSHCLEHMSDPSIALANWIRVVKPEGHLVITVPDWEMYEHRLWPSRFNGGHRTAWSTKGWAIGTSPYQIRYVESFLGQFTDKIDIIEAQRIVEHYDETQPETVDQTLGLAECCIEMILIKR
jgi:SAM-dependent methyltransferase